MHLAGDRPTLLYRSPDMTPASYTVLNFPVDDVEAAVDQLTGRGVEFERYEGFEQDEKGIAHGPGPTIAWFKDPSGNVHLGAQRPARLSGGLRPGSAPRPGSRPGPAARPRCRTARSSASPRRGGGCRR